MSVADIAVLLSQQVYVFNFCSLRAFLFFFIIKDNSVHTFVNVPAIFPKTDTAPRLYPVHVERFSFSDNNFCGGIKHSIKKTEIAPENLLRQSQSATRSEALL